jgi:hypothetical protein
MGVSWEDIARHLVHIWQADEHRRLIHYAKSEDEEVKKKARRQLKLRNHLAYIGLGVSGICLIWPAIVEVFKLCLGIRIAKRL